MTNKKLLEAARAANPHLVGNLCLPLRDKQIIFILDASSIQLHSYSRNGGLQLVDQMMIDGDVVALHHNNASNHIVVTTSMLCFELDYFQNNLHLAKQYSRVSRDTKRVLL